MPRDWGEGIGVVLDERPLKLREAADRLGVSPDTMRRWIKAGVVPAFRVGVAGQYRIRQVDLEAARRK